jgi:hypothetical protein
MLPVADLILATFAPEGSGTIICKWALSPKMMFQTVALCFPTSKVISHSLILLLLSDSHLSKYQVGILTPT